MLARGPSLLRERPVTAKDKKERKIDEVSGFRLTLSEKYGTVQMSILEANLERSSFLGLQLYGFQIWYIPRPAAGSSTFRQATQSASRQ